jgi:hypothetical protein
MASMDLPSDVERAAEGSRASLRSDDRAHATGLPPAGFRADVPTDVPADDPAGDSTGDLEPRVVPAFRARGLLVMAVLVATGVGVTAGYLQLEAPEVGEIIANRKREIALAPKTPEGRLEQWLVFGAPQIHHRMQMMRFSAEQPWLVTHAVRLDGEDAERLAIYGIDLSELPREIAGIGGLDVHVKLPLPRRLGTGPLRGDNAVSVPVAPRDGLAPDSVERARFLVRFALDGLSQALERDIPGAKLTIEIGPESSWEEITEARAAK